MYVPLPVSAEPPPPDSVVVELGFDFSAAAMSTPHWAQNAVREGWTPVELHSSSYWKAMVM